MKKNAAMAVQMSDSDTSSGNHSNHRDRGNSGKEAETEVAPGEAASNQQHHQEGGSGDKSNSFLRQLQFQGMPRAEITRNRRHTLGPEAVIVSAVKI